MESTHEDQPILKVKVYPGADSDFTLYKDDGTTYAYESGNNEIAKLHWDDANRKLTQQGAKAWDKTQLPVEIVK